MTWILDIGGVHLTSDTANQGGAANAHASTPFSVRTGWTPTVARPRAAYQGTGAMANGASLSYLAYDNVEEDIPLGLYGSSHLNAAQRLQELKRLNRAASYSQPAVWRWRPEGGMYDLYTEVYVAHEFESPGTQEIGIGAMEGGYDVEGTLQVTRYPLFGQKDLDTLINGASFGNQGTGTPDNVESLEGTIPLKGDLIYEGQPLNIRVSKPASQTAAQLYLATVYSRTQQTITSTKTTTSATGLDFTASTAIDLSALRARQGVRCRVTARVTSLTNPGKAQLRATIQTASGNTLWQGPWIALGSNTTAQLADLHGSGLDALRVPLASAANVLVLVTIRSSDGTSVTATLDYVEAILYYDWCVVDAGTGMASGQRLHLFGAQNAAGGGWLPNLNPNNATVTDSSDVQVKSAVAKGGIPRAFSGASLYVAWKESDGGHTKTDTTTITVQHCPLYRSIRGVT
jgi:hypothetical protein